jgi:processive 1,2-diacylglycerol beta-glucosyltransferase
MTRVLILYLVQNSGHHAAARYLDLSLRRLAPDMETRCVDLLEHTHPRWEKVIRRMYMTTLRRTPELWEALYDNMWVEYLTRRLRGMIQQGRSESLRRLMNDFAPQAVVCTQAYPFAVMASFAARHAPDLPLFAVTTDFVPHRFWCTANAHSALYVVPTESAAARLMWLGIPRQRIHVLGIPVAAERAAIPPPEEPGAPDARRILIMGGGYGMGIRYQTIRSVDRCPESFTIDVVCGTNNRLRRRLARNRHRFKHPIRVRGYVRNAVALMTRADLMITKAGGLTLSEAACVGVPLILVHPLPGQEKGNAEVLVHSGAALHIPGEHEVTRCVSMLLGSPMMLVLMREKALAFARPDAADQIARLVINSIPKGESS